MVDDDTTQRRLGRLGPFDAFHRILGSTMVACDQLGGAIRSQDIAGAERAATDAVESWLAMRRALRKLELDAVVRGTRLQAARSATRAYRARWATSWIAHGRSLTRCRCTRSVQLRFSMAIANDECGGRANDGRDGDPPGEI